MAVSSSAASSRPITSKQPAASSSASSKHPAASGRSSGAPSLQRGASSNLAPSNLAIAEAAKASRNAVAAAAGSSGVASASADAPSTSAASASTFGARQPTGEAANDAAAANDTAAARAAEATIEIDGPNGTLTLRVGDAVQARFKASSCTETSKTKVWQTMWFAGTISAINAEVRAPRKPIRDRRLSFALWSSGDLSPALARVTAHSHARCWPPLPPDA